MNTKILLLGALLAAPLASAEELPEIPAVSDAIAAAIENDEVAGAVTLFAEGGELKHLAAAGHADIEADEKMETDDLFWIASMTKPVVGVAVLMLQDEGKLSIDDPVSKYLPEYEDLKDADGDPVSITIAQCLAHISGLADLSREESQQVTTLAEIASLAAAKPVNFPPGSKWSYCQTSINAVARIVEVVSEQDFPEFLEERLFGPLGMKDTTFYPTEAQADRLATAYRVTDDGEFEPAPVPILHGKSLASRERAPLANGGLFSTARDYYQLCRMLLNEGELDGRRYLSAEAVGKLSELQTGELATGFTPGNGWAIGTCVVREPQGTTAALSPGSYGHGGAYGTQAWIDPEKERIFILMVQRANFPNSDNSAIRAAFQNAAAEASQ